MCKLKLIAASRAGRCARISRALWQEFFGPTWGEPTPSRDIAGLNERDLTDIGMIRVRYGIDPDEAFLTPVSEGGTPRVH